MSNFLNGLGAIGKKYDQDKIRFDLIPVEAIEALARVLKMGSEKYGDNNWREGIHYHRVYRAAQHHLQEFWGDHPDKDDESGLPHLYHALCNIAFLITYEDNKERYRIFDDRAGSNSEFYRQQEELVSSITKLVQDNSSFFECRVGDDKLQKVYDTLDYAIHSPYTTKGKEETLQSFPDLTKMTHPEACEHLEVGMRVRVLKEAGHRECGWPAWWAEPMGGFIGKEFIIEELHPSTGPAFRYRVDSRLWHFPAFVLEIVSRLEDRA